MERLESLVTLSLRVVREAVLVLTCALWSSLLVLCAKPPGLGLFQANVQVHIFTQEQRSVSVSVLATFCEIKQANIQYHSSSQASISHKRAPSLSFFKETEFH